MQKRSFSGEIRYGEVGLDPLLPIRGGDPFIQGDYPITFLHFHKCLEVGYCYSGSGIFMIGEKIFSFQAGDVTFIPPREVHLAKSDSRTVSEWTWIYLDPVRLIGPVGADLKMLDPSAWIGPDFGNVLSRAEHPGLNRIVLEMVEELRSQKKGRIEALRALSWQLMVLARRLAPGRKRQVGFRSPEYDRVVPALQYIAQHYAKPVDVKTAALCCRLSVPHFRRVFLRAIGRSPREYWHDMRLRMAASLLGSSSLSVLEISQEVGFETLSSFNRLFRKRFKVPPRTWRRG